MMANVNAAASMVPRPVLMSNLDPIFEVLPPLHQYYLRVNVRTRTPSVTKWQIFVFVCFYMSLKATPMV